MNTALMERITILGQLAADAELLACGPGMSDEERNILRMQAAEFRDRQFEELRVESDYHLAMVLRPAPNVSHKPGIFSDLHSTWRKALCWSCAFVAVYGALALGYWLVRCGAGLELAIGLAAVVALWKPVTAKL